MPKLVVNMENLTLDSLELLENFDKNRGKLDIPLMKELMACLLANEDGTPMDPDEARKVVGRLTIRQITEAANQLTDEFKKSKDAAVPPLPVSS